MTEARGTASSDLDLRSTAELVGLMNREDATVAGTVGASLGEIAAVVDEIAERLRRGGRLIYVGAGSSGRLAEVDAAECEATFSTRPGQVVAVVAGSDAATALEREAAEDDAAAGARAVEQLAAGPDDAVITISASGRTPYAVGAARAAAKAGAFTACVVCALDSELARANDRAIAVVVGPEVLAGSTRLKAGTAQKLVLNMLSTVSMIRLGKTYGGLMVDVVPANDKLRSRVRRIVAEATGAAPRDGRRRARRVRRRRQGRDRLHPHGDRRGRRPRETGRVERQPPTRARPVKLDVAAALVDGRLVPGQVEIVDGRIARYGLSGSNGRVRGIAVPGFVDLQVNGFAGVDFLEADADGYRVAGEALLETGVTSFLPTLITAEEEDLLAALAEVPLSSDGPRILGVHLEGPFLAAARLGTHPPAGRRDPDVALLERLLAAGPVRMMTLAPELPDALELIDVLNAHGVVVSCGHSDATAEQADVAFDRGARTVTHLFNAMRPLTHRRPGHRRRRARARRRRRPDHRRRHPPRACDDRARLARGRGTSRARHRRGRGRQRERRLVQPRQRRAERAGRSRPRARRNARRQRADDDRGGPQPARARRAARGALDAASAVPARVLGLTDAGRLDVGMPADLVVLDDNLEIESVFVGGEARVVA